MVYIHIYIWDGAYSPKYLQTSCQRSPMSVGYLELWFQSLNLNLNLKSVYLTTKQKQTLSNVTQHKRYVLCRETFTKALSAPLATLQWRHNKRACISNDVHHDCLLNRLLRRRSKKTSKLRVTGLCGENSPANGKFPAHRASKIIPFDDVIMVTATQAYCSAWTGTIPMKNWSFGRILWECVS